MIPSSPLTLVTSPPLVIPILILPRASFWKALSHYEVNGLEKARMEIDQLL